jgi:Family of unknown function (DUF6510)
MTGSNLWSDGNALAGPLQDVFRVDVTTAVGRCTACGRTAPMAEVRVFRWLGIAVSVARDSV